MRDLISTRRERRRKLHAAGAVRRASNDGLYIVKSATNVHQEYAVRIGARARCKCGDFQARGVVCKHMLAVTAFERAARWGVTAR
jgi:hypothetical protein